MIRAFHRLIQERGNEGVATALEALLHGARRVRVPRSLHSEMARRDALRE